MKKTEKTFFIVDYLNLSHVGILEMAFALTPMLTGYSLCGLPLYLLNWVLLLVIVVFKGGGHCIKVFKPLLYLFAYWSIHQILIMMVDDVNIYGQIQQIMYFVAAFVLYPRINLQKLKGSMNWVALVAIVGLLYQWGEITNGNMVHQLEIPGLQLDENSMEKILQRPSSFFQEPSAYAAYMIYPLFFALFDKKYLWAIGLVLSMFLTTSTTGIVLSFIIIGVSAFNMNKSRAWSWTLLVLIAGGLFFALTTFKAFDASVEKIENTDASTNVRLSQGGYIVSTMETSEYIFGAPYSTAYNYCKSGRAPDVAYYGKSVFMPTFWLLILLYGIIGLCLYLNIYLQILRKSRIIMPLVFAQIAALFTSGYAIGELYIYSFTILMTIVTKEKSKVRICDV